MESSEVNVYKEVEIQVII